MPAGSATAEGGVVAAAADEPGRRAQHDAPSVRTLDAEALALATAGSESISFLGTVAKENPQLVAEACRKFPGRIVVGIDARDGLVAVRYHVPLDDRRRAYELTPLGRAAAKAEARRLAELVTLARGKSLIGRAK